MDQFFAKMTAALGSTPVIAGFGLWMVTHTALNLRYLDFISELAIFIGLVIVRGQLIDSREMRDISKRDLAATKRVENKVS